MTINYQEMRLWIMNDEGLYNLWKNSRLPISQFIKENSKELRSIIRGAIK